MTARARAEFEDARCHLQAGRLRAALEALEAADMYNMVEALDAR